MAETRDWGVVESQEAGGKERDEENREAMGSGKQGWRGMRSMTSNVHRRDEEVKGGQQ